MSDQRIKIAITVGDPNGIGPEIVIKALSDSRITEMFTPVVYGSAKTLAFYKKGLEGCEQFNYSLVASGAEAKHKRINLVECAPEEFRTEPGTACEAAGRVAADSLERAVADLAAGMVDAVVTAPVDKAVMQSAGFPFTGHTEFFAERLGGKPLMMLCSEQLRVGLVTIHLPLAQVAGNINGDVIVDSLARMCKALIQDFEIVEPHIAVLSLNPHCGDGGLLGTEEEQIIKPAIQRAAAQGILAFGPFAADGFFATEGYGKYDAVLAMYHDQGLAPFKTISPDGVNFTAGLTAVRTSPDHGVAFDIAGEGKADESSMRNAIYTALDILRSRRRYAEISADPLRHYERDKGADMSVNDLPQQPDSDN